MTKQEKIKEAYGKHWDEVWQFVDMNGWCTRLDYSQSISEKVNHRSLSEMGFRPEDNLIDTGMCLKTGNAIWRPKSLQSIENNNGWIKIENENWLKSKQLNEITKYYVNDINEDYLTICVRVEIDNKEFVYMTLSDYLFILQELEKEGISATHYQPITKPKPPIY